MLKQVFDIILITGVLCWRGDEHNAENNQESSTNVTVHVNNSLLRGDEHNSGNDIASSSNGTVHIHSSLLNNPD